MITKELDQYYLYKDGYVRGACKECYKDQDKKRRNGIKIEIIKHIPWNKGLKLNDSIRNKISESLKGRKITSEQKEKQIKTLEKYRTSTKRKSWIYNDWAKKVKERDKFTCQHCGIKDKDKLQSHHIIPWEDSEELRFIVENGLTLCRSCHTKEDRRIKPIKAWNKNLKLSEQHKEKLSKARKGKSPWNKGLKKNNSQNIQGD